MLNFLLYCYYVLIDYYIAILTTKLPSCQTSTNKKVGGSIVGAQLSGAQLLGAQFSGAQLSGLICRPTNFPTIYSKYGHRMQDSTLIWNN